MCGLRTKIAQLKKTMAVGEKVVKHENFLKSLTQARGAQEKSTLLINATNEQLLTLVEICLNVLHSRVSLTSAQKQKLYKNREFIRRLARVKTVSGARKIVRQKGAGPILATLLIPILGELAQRAISQL